MLLEFHQKGTLFRYESILPTDSATISFWQGDILKLPPFEDKNLYKNNKRKVVIAETGKDGYFRTIFNYKCGLLPQDKKYVYKKKLGILIENSSYFYLGDINYVSSDGKGEKAYQRGNIDKVNFPKGKYILDAYSLVTRDENGEPQFLQFAFNLFPAREYKNQEVEKSYLKDNLKFSYKK